MGYMQKRHIFLEGAYDREMASRQPRYGAKLRTYKRELFVGIQFCRKYRHMFQVADTGAINTDHKRLHDPA